MKRNFFNVVNKQQRNLLSVLLISVLSVSLLCSCGAKEASNQPTEKKIAKSKVEKVTETTEDTEIKVEEVTENTENTESTEEVASEAPSETPVAEQPTQTTQTQTTDTSTYSAPTTQTTSTEGQYGYSVSGHALDANGYYINSYGALCDKDDNHQLSDGTWCTSDGRIVGDSSYTDQWGNTVYTEPTQGIIYLVRDASGNQIAGSPTAYQTWVNEHTTYYAIACNDCGACYLEKAEHYNGTCHYCGKSNLSTLQETGWQNDYVEYQTP